jgi:hypothetical protein
VKPVLSHQTCRPSKGSGNINADKETESETAVKLLEASQYLCDAYKTRVLLPSYILCRMASMPAMYDRVLSNQQASTSFCHVANIKPGLYSCSRKPMRVVAASATQAPANSVAKVPVVETKEQGGGPGRVFLSSTRAAAGQLWGVLKFFQAEEEAAMSPGIDGNVLGDTAKRAEQVNEVARS